MSKIFVFRTILSDRKNFVFRFGRFPVLIYPPELNFYSKLREQVTTPPTYSLFWLQTLFCSHKAFYFDSFLFVLWSPFLVLRQTQYYDLITKHLKNRHTFYHSKISIWIPTAVFSWTRLLPQPCNPVLILDFVVYFN